ncbi:MAG: archaellin/type IV pilin N-terminal domain-containing protein [Nanoarchaeota archaeon]|nr:hypothetical protein [Nanoarchaeota archaeon]MBU4451352.1 hypothetical protein [Nanoarchaeota archaeon]MCG2723755.1 hypothetical protein [archaeon]
MRLFLNTKSSKRKAQAEVISALLIVGITVAAVSVAYMWGVPMIQKGQSTSQIQEAEYLMTLISDGITDVAQNGGQKSLSLNLQGPLEISEEDNTIKYTIISKKAGVARTEWVPLNEDETFGIAATNQSKSIPVYGFDKDAVLLAKSDVLGDSGFMVYYNLVFREVDDFNTREGRITNITAAGNNKVSGGTVKLMIRRNPQIVSPSPSKLGGKLISTKVLLSLS